MVDPYPEPCLRLYYLELQVERASPVRIPRTIRLSEYDWLDTAFRPRLEMLAVVGMSKSCSHQKLNYKATFTCYLVVFEGDISRWITLDDIVISDYKGNEIHYALMI